MKGNHSCNKVRSFFCLHGVLVMESERILRFGIHEQRDPAGRLLNSQHLATFRHMHRTVNGDLGQTYHESLRNAGRDWFKAKKHFGISKTLKNSCDTTSNHCKNEKSTTFLFQSNRKCMPHSAAWALEHRGRPEREGRPGLMNLSAHFFMERELIQSFWCKKKVRPRKKKPWTLHQTMSSRW